MNEQVKQLWIDALRSGKYKQTTGNLHTSEGYCCLGVLVDCYLQQINSHWQTMLYSPKVYAIEIEDEWVSGRLPYHKDFRNWTGNIHEMEDVLIMLNDEHQVNFKQIANWIEEHL